MPELVDPTDSLISFQYAFSNGLIKPSPCIVHPNMKVLLDDAEVHHGLLMHSLKEKMLKVLLYMSLQSLLKVNHALALAMQ